MRKSKGGDNTRTPTLGLLSLSVAKLTGGKSTKTKTKRNQENQWKSNGKPTKNKDTTNDTTKSLGKPCKSNGNLVRKSLKIKENQRGINENQGKPNANQGKPMKNE